MSDLTGIAESLVRARIARDEGNASAELAALQQAVAHQDALPYTEPPLWHYPVRQTLGEAQIRAGEFSAAKETFAEDLIHFPANPWSLFGLESAQRQLGENVGELTDQRKHAWRNSDIDPDKIICWEHPNFAADVLLSLSEVFGNVSKTYWPFPFLPIVDCNLVVKFICRKLS